MKANVTRSIDGFVRLDEYWVTLVDVLQLLRLVEVDRELALRVQRVGAVAQVADPEQNINI